MPLRFKPFNQADLTRFKKICYLAAKTFFTPR